MRRATVKSGVCFGLLSFRKTLQQTNSLATTALLKCSSGTSCIAVLRMVFDVSAQKCGGVCKMLSTVARRLFLGSVIALSSRVSACIPTRRAIPTTLAMEVTQQATHRPTTIRSPRAKRSCISPATATTRSLCNAAELFTARLSRRPLICDQEWCYPTDQR